MCFQCVFFECIFGEYIVRERAVWPHYRYCSNMGLFCWNMGLFCWNTGLFCWNIRLFCWNVRLFCQPIPRSAFKYKTVHEQNIGLFLCEYRAL